ncbi:MAG: DUF6054 family protein [Tissierellia bacterium]|nr:DUF6054 family protein [Tissierellia bacterium]
MSVFQENVKGDFEIFEKYFISSVEKELGSTRLAGKQCFEKDDFILHMYVLEKYFWRNNTYSSLTLTLSQEEDDIKVTAIASGSGVGLLGFDWGADERAMHAVKQAINQWNSKLGKRK